MKLVRNETARTLSENLTVYFEPLAPAGQFWRERGRTHSQAFRFEVDGREYWGEVIRTFDRAAPSGERVRVDVELRTRSGAHGRALPENQRVLWRAAIKRQFARDLAAFVEAQGRDPEPVPAGPETVPATAEAATVTIETNWAAASGIIETALTHGTGEGRRMAREELGRMAALADERNALAPQLTAMREALLTLAIIANETAHCIGEPGDSCRDEMDSAIKGAFAAMGTEGAGPSPLARIAEAARRAREARGGLSGGPRDVVQSILAALDPAESDPLPVFDFDGDAMRVAARPVLYSGPVARVTVTDSDSDGSPCYRVAAEAEDGSPVAAIQYAPDHAAAQSHAHAMAAQFGVCIHDSTDAGRAALAARGQA